MVNVEQFIDNAWEVVLQGATPDEAQAFLTAGVANNLQMREVTTDDAPAEAAKPKRKATPRKPKVHTAQDAPPPDGKPEPAAQDTPAEVPAAADGDSLEAYFTDNADKFPPEPTTADPNAKMVLDTEILERVTRGDDNPSIAGDELVIKLARAARVQPGVSLTRRVQRLRRSLADEPEAGEPTSPGAVEGAMEQEPTTPPTTEEPVVLGDLSLGDVLYLASDNSRHAVSKLRRAKVSTGVTACGMPVNAKASSDTWTRTRPEAAVETCDACNAFVATPPALPEPAPTPPAEDADTAPKATRRKTAEPKAPKPEPAKPVGEPLDKAGLFPVYGDVLAAIGSRDDFALGHKAKGPEALVSLCGRSADRPSSATFMLLDKGIITCNACRRLLGIEAVTRKQANGVRYTLLVTARGLEEKAAQQAIRAYERERNKAEARRAEKRAAKAAALAAAAADSEDQAATAA